MPSTTGFDRRSFLKGAGMTALAGAASSSKAVIADDDDGGGLFKNGHYDFETVYERGGWNCARWDGPTRRYPDGEFKYGMGVATMDFECPPCITEALAERCKHHTWGYMSSTISLREAIAEFNAERNNLELDPSTIQLSSAVLPGMIAAIRTFSRPASKIVQLSPAYSGFYGIARHTYTDMVDSEMQQVDGRYEIDWDDLEAKLADPEAQTMIVCNPQNPTGNVWTEEELLKIGQLCLQNDVIVLSDEIHSDFVRPGHKYVPFARLPDKDIVNNSLSFNSASKTFNMAGMKNAYWHSSDPSLLSRVQHYHYGAINTLGYVAHEAAYRDGGEWLDQLLAYLDDNHKFTEDYVARNMPSVGLTRPEGTYLVWLDFSETMDKIGAAEMAEKKKMRSAEVYFQDWLVKNSGVYLNPGTVYGQGGSGRMRLNVGSSRKVVKAALDLVAEAIDRA